MELPKVIIRGAYSEFLNGREVKAALADSSAAPLQPGARVIAFKDSIAAATDVPVPKQQQAHYIGVEGTVTEVEVVSSGHATSDRQLIRIKKI